jgi:hypothetical protein
MQIRVVNYTTSASPMVQAFVDVELDGWLRFNGLNLHRDGKLWSAQLTRMIHGQRTYRNAVEILDGDLCELLRADIMAAIHAYIETLPPEERVRPVSARQAETPANPPEPKKPEPINGRKPVLPPERLLVASRVDTAKRSQP